uniref:Uncharacterized protein n=1 Tax=Oryza brachyantha TaxID=4533 RepID=J3LWJ9_ORYBR
MDRAIGVMTCPYSAIVPWRKACSISPAAAAGGAHQGGTGAGTRRQRAHDHRLSAAAPPSCSVLLASVCNTLDALIDRLIDPPELRPSVHPGRVLSGNFAPTDELPPTRCPVVRGSIPSSLAGGAYVRNGPNPRHRLPGRTHHLFDGDGMLHSLLLPSPPSPTTSPSSLSEPVLCSRYVQTYKYLLERETGTPVFPNFFAGFHGVAGLARAAVMLGRVLAGQIKLKHGFGVANTSVVFFAECLYALCESDIPYSVFISPSTGEVTTLGRCDFDGRLAIAMTAHPKKDPITGELFAFRYSILQPFITYFWFDAAGNKCADVPIFSSEQPSVLHDFAITEHYTIFVESQLVVKPSSGSLVGFDPAKVPRIGVLPRYARDDSEMRWFDVPGFNMLHTTNAWEEAAGDEVVLVAPSHLSLEHMAVGDMELLESRVYMVRVNIRTGAVSRAAVSPESLEYGVVHHGYVAAMGILE